MKRVDDLATELFPEEQWGSLGEQWGSLGERWGSLGEQCGDHWASGGDHWASGGDRWARLEGVDSGDLDIDVVRESGPGCGCG